MEREKGRKGDGERGRRREGGTERWRELEKVAVGSEK